jgi:3-deoxy-7-phosphoheptulonate synthase
VHVAPEQALCDGKQALLPQQFADLMGRLARLADGLGRHMSGA